MRTRNPALTDRRRKEILNAAASCFVRHGFHQTSMDQICAEAGLSPGTMYRYFDGKQAIITSIAAAHRAESIEVLNRLAGAPNFVEGFIDVVEEIVRASANTEDARLSLEIMAEASRDPKMARILARHETEVRKHLVRMLRRAINQGDVKPSLKPEIVADLLLALIDGIMGRSLFNPKYGDRAFAQGLRVLVSRFLGPPSKKNTQATAKSTTATGSRRHAGRALRHLFTADQRLTV